VNIRVAIGTIFSHIGEDGLCVTLDALHFFVHATQRIFRFVVIEFGNRPDGTPT
jgi:hypothetical protein